MKRATKIILIISGVMAVLGLAFMIAGAIAAGNIGLLVEEVKNGEWNYNEERIEDLLDAAEDVTGIFSRRESLTNEFSQDIKKLEMELDLADVTIKATDTDTFTVRFEDGYLKYYDTAVDGDTLHISYKTGTNVFRQEPKIIVSVPRRMSLESIFVNTDLGEIDLENLENALHEIELNAALGNIEVSDCRVNGICSAAADMGDVEFEDVFCETVDLLSSMGNVELSGKVTGDVTIEVDMGNAKAEIEGKEEDYNIDISTDAGNVTFHRGHHGKHTGNSYYHSVDQIKPTIFMRGSMGNVELKIEE